jgi:hypothetical protein
MALSNAPFWLLKEQLRVTLLAYNGHSILSLNEYILKVIKLNA